MLSGNLIYETGHEKYSFLRRGSSSYPGMDDSNEYCTDGGTDQVRHCVLPEGKMPKKEDDRPSKSDEDSLLMGMFNIDYVHLKTNEHGGLERPPSIGVILPHARKGGVEKVVWFYLFIADKSTDVTLSITPSSLSKIEDGATPRKAAAPTAAKKKVKKGVRKGATPENAVAPAPQSKPKNAASKEKKVRKKRPNSGGGITKKKKRNKTFKRGGCNKNKKKTKKKAF